MRTALGLLLMASAVTGVFLFAGLHEPCWLALPLAQPVVEEFI